MPKTKRDEMTAGVFVLSALAITVGVVLWLGSGELFGNGGQKAVFYVPADAPGAGIAKGSPVQRGGAEVGRIIEVNFRPDLNRTLYVAQMDEGVVVRADGEVVAVSGLIGGGILAILSEGTEGAPLADADNPVLITGGMEQAMMDLAASMATVRNTLETQLDVDNPEALLAKIHVAADGLVTASANAASLSGSLADELNAELPDALISKIHARVDELGEFIPQLTIVAERLSAMLASGQELIGKLNSGEGTLGALVNDPRLFKSLLDSVDELGLMIQDARSMLESWKATGIPLKLK